MRNGSTNATSEADISSRGASTRSSSATRATCRYVVLNPLRAGICTRPAAWPWSSYRATAGFSSRPAFLTLTTILSSFARDTANAVAAYRAFVDDVPPAQAGGGAR